MTGDVTEYAAAIDLLTSHLNMTQWLSPIATKWLDNARGHLERNFEYETRGWTQPKAPQPEAGA